MNNIKKIVLCLIFLAYNINVLGQCDPFTVAHYNLSNLPANIGGVNVSVSGVNSGPVNFSNNTSCSKSNYGAIGLYPTNTATFTFSQPVYEVTFAPHAMNISENGTVTTNGGIPVLSTNCSSDFTITGNNFERTGGAEAYNGLALKVLIPGGATTITFTCNASSQDPNSAWILELLNCISTLNLEDNEFDENLKVYPNPTKSEFTVDLGESHNYVLVTLTDVNNRLIYSNTYNNSQLINLNIDGPAGFYFLTIETESKKSVMKLIKD